MIERLAKHSMTQAILKRPWARVLVATGLGAIAASFKYVDVPSVEPGEYSRAAGTLAMMNFGLKLFWGVAVFVFSSALLLILAHRWTKSDMPDAHEYESTIDGRDLPNQ